ncbi:MAG: hypothetical protein ACI4C4_07980 [Lachnospiraceae bacterium]
MRELSIFIDESGDFGEVKERPAYYLVTFVFHDQSNNIDQQVSKLEESVRISGFNLEYIHTGPLIRREEVFSRYSIDERRKLLYKMLNFVNGCPISYLTVIVDRKEAADFICSMELLRIKKDEKRLSRSEERFFYRPQELKKTFLKSVDKKRL